MEIFEKLFRCSSKFILISSYNCYFSRKRKWDLDDQGKKAPPSTAAPTPKSIKAGASSDESDSKDTSTTPNPDPNLAAG